MRSPAGRSVYGSVAGSGGVASGGGAVGTGMGVVTAAGGGVGTGGSTVGIDGGVTAATAEVTVAISVCAGLSVGLGGAGGDADGAGAAGWDGDRAGVFEVRALCSDGVCGAAGAGRSTRADVMVGVGRGGAAARACRTVAERERRSRAGWSTPNGRSVRIAPLAPWCAVGAASVATSASSLCARPVKGSWDGSAGSPTAIQTPQRATIAAGGSVNRSIAARVARVTARSAGVGSWTAAIERARRRRRSRTGRSSRRRS
jgi:hypothetical protein